MPKYCTLPGQEPVRLDSLDGHIIIIGEEPREIPEQFVLKAKAAGCQTEEELESLKRRLLGDSAPVQTIQTSLLQGTITLPPQDSDNDDFPPPPGHTAPLSASATNSDRAEQIKAAVIEMMNTGNPSDFTSNGTPKVEVLKDKLGFVVTVLERDAAYEAAKG